MKSSAITASLQWKIAILLICFCYLHFHVQAGAAKTKILFCPTASKGHYNPFMTIIKQLIKYNQENGPKYEISASIASIEKVSMTQDWIQQDFSSDDYQVIDQPKNQTKDSNKKLHFYKFGEWKGDILNLPILDMIDTAASFSIQSFNFLMERFENYPHEKPDIMVVDSLDIYHSYFDIFQQLNFKFNNSVRMVTLSTSLSEVLDFEEFQLTHPNSLTELFWGFLVDSTLGKVGLLHEYYQWLKLRVWKYSIFSISLNIVITHLIMPFLKFAFHCFALLKIRPSYRSTYIVQPFSSKMYGEISNQYPSMIMSAPGVIESIRMKPYPKYFDIGFPISVPSSADGEGSSSFTGGIEKWLNEIEHQNGRLVFLSTGSQFKLSLDTNRKILKGFSILLKNNQDLHVLMRVESSQQAILEKELHDNQLDISSSYDSSNNNWKKRVRLSSEFLPQPFILNHKATKLFVTHCGYNSVSEGIVYGKLLVGIPITADQYLICNRIQDKGFGDWIYSTMITPPNFSELIESTLNNNQIQNRIEWASSMTRHYSSNSSEILHSVFEFTMRYFNNGTNHVENGGLRLPLEHSLTIIATTFLQLVVSLYLLVWTCSKWCCSRRKETRKEKRE